MRSAPIFSVHRAENSVRTLFAPQGRGRLRRFSDKHTSGLSIRMAATPTIHSANSTGTTKLVRPKIASSTSDRKKARKQEPYGCWYVRVSSNAYLTSVVSGTCGSGSSILNPPPASRYQCRWRLSLGPMHFSAIPTTSAGSSTHPKQRCPPSTGKPPQKNSSPKSTFTCSNW